MAQTAAFDPSGGSLSSKGVERWPTEVPLFLVSVLFSIPIWIALLVSVIGAVYLFAIAIFLFFVHLGFIAHVRGSGVRVGPGQLPQLDASVQRLAREIGMKK